MPQSANPSNGALGASLLFGVFLSTICLGKFAAPVAFILGFFVGLPLLWKYVVSKMCEDTLTQALLMGAAGLFIIGVALCF